MSNNREMSKSEISRWNDDMVRKQKLMRGESLYEGEIESEEGLENLMSSGNAAWVKYRKQEEERAAKAAEVARINTDFSISDKCRVFKELAERFSSSLLPRVGLLEAQKIGAETYQKFCDEANIKDISVPSYHRYEKRESIDESGKGKKFTSWTERKRKGLSGVPQDFLDNPLNEDRDQELIAWWWKNNSIDDLLK